LSVDTSDTIGILKAKITSKEQLPAEKLVLIFAGKILSDGTRLSRFLVTLEDNLEKCNIEKESCIHVVQRAAGQVAPTGQRNGVCREDSLLIQ
jgi:Ubiquitin family